MTFASETSLPRFPTSDAHCGDGCAVPGRRENAVAAFECTQLDPFVYREMRHCPNCGGPQLFVPMFEIEIGRVGLCFGCGEERIVRFSRTTSEAA